MRKSEILKYLKKNLKNFFRYFNRINNKIKKLNFLNRNIRLILMKYSQLKISYVF